MSRSNILVCCVALTLIAFAALPANATTIYIDFGTNGTQPTYGTPAAGQMTGTYNGTFYNDIAVVDDYFTVHTLQPLQFSVHGSQTFASSAVLNDTSNAATPWSISFQDAVPNTTTIVQASGTGATYAGAYPAALSGIATTALEDSVSAAWGGTLEVIFTGLDPTKRYDLVAYGAANNTGAQAGTYTPTVGSGANFTTATFADYRNSSTVVNWTGVQPDATGTIAFTIAARRVGILAQLRHQPGDAKVELFVHDAGGHPRTIDPCAGGLRAARAIGLRLAAAEIGGNDRRTQWNRRGRGGTRRESFSRGAAAQPRPRQKAGRRRHGLLRVLRVLGGGFSSNTLRVRK